MSTAPILRRTRADLVAASAITIAVLFMVSVVWMTAPIRHAELTPAPETFTASEPLAHVPAQLHPAWSVDIEPIAGLHRPLSISGLVVHPEGSSVHALDPATGEKIWTYRRDHDTLCSLSVAFEAVIATYRTNVGCGDVVAINANTGTYKATRSAVNSENVVPVASNSAVGTLSNDRLELWRSDLVRTIEYGHVEAPQEPNQQPHQDCSINSALTRTELLALVNHCPGADTSALRFLNTTPEDSRQPVIDNSVDLPRDARLVAIGQNAAAVYLPSGPADQAGNAHLRSYDKNGRELGSISVASSPLINDQLDPHKVFSPAIADLPHHMSWFDGRRLYLFEPDTLIMSAAFDDALGTGIAVGGQLLFPTKAGIAVADWNTGKTLRVIPVDRGSYAGPVSLNQAGGQLIEQRGNTYVGLA